MTKKDRLISILALIFAVFLFVCTVINLFAGNIGAAICGLAAGGFLMCVWYVYREKSKKDGESKQ